MSKVYEAWKKEVSKLREFEKEKIPVVVRRCPKCLNLSIDIDIEKGRVYCTKCGFEMNLKMSR